MGNEVKTKRSEKMYVDKDEVLNDSFHIIINDSVSLLDCIKNERRGFTDISGEAELNCRRALIYKSLLAVSSLTEEESADPDFKTTPKGKNIETVMFVLRNVFRNLKSAERYEMIERLFPYILMLSYELHIRKDYLWRTTDINLGIDFILGSLSILYEFDPDRFQMLLDHFKLNFQFKNEDFDSLVSDKLNNYLADIKQLNSFCQQVIKDNLQSDVPSFDKSLEKISKTKILLEKCPDIYAIANVPDIFN